MSGNALRHFHQSFHSRSFDARPLDGSTARYQVRGGIKLRTNDLPKCQKCHALGVKTRKVE